MDILQLHCASQSWGRLSMCFVLLSEPFGCMCISQPGLLGRPHLAWLRKQESCAAGSTRNGCLGPNSCRVLRQTSSHHPLALKWSCLRLVRGGPIGSKECHVGSCMEHSNTGTELNTMPHALTRCWVCACLTP